MVEPGFAILHENLDCLVVNKPAGIATQAPVEFDSVERRIRYWLAQRSSLPPTEVYLGVPHRLDRPASGGLLFALNRNAARRVSQQFERRQIGKSYWAIVSGRIEPAAGTWSDYLQKIYGHPEAKVVTADAPDARLAVLHYRTLAGDLAIQGEVFSALEITLETGRTHQIRVQAASRGHPVWGDIQYGSTVEFGDPPADERQRAIALHARSLSFKDPHTRQMVHIVAPPPPTWQNSGLPLDDGLPVHGSGAHGR